MGTIILGDGTEAVRIEGDALRVDSLATRIGYMEQKVELVKIFEGPTDDIRISELPEAIRDIASMFLNFHTLKVSYPLQLYSWLIYSKELGAWRKVFDNERLVQEETIGYAIAVDRITFSGIIPLTTKSEIGQDIAVNNLVVGKVIAANFGLKTPWAQKWIA